MATDRFLELTVFVEVARRGGFSAAARTLSLSPSAVSKMIGRLETRLGVPLLNRTSRVVKLTPEGDGFFDSVARLLEDLGRAESQLKSQKNSPRGIIRIAAHPTVASTLLAPVLQEFISDNPNIKVDVSVWVWPKSNLSTESVESNLDVVLMHGKLADSSMISRKAGIFRRIICAAPSYLAAHGTPATPDDLLNHNCLFGPVFQNYWPLRGQDVTKRLPVVGNVTSNHPELLRKLAVSGVGIIRLPDFYIREDLAAGRLVPILADNRVEDEEPIQILYQSHRAAIPRVKMFIDYLSVKIKSRLQRS